MNSAQTHKPTNTNLFTLRISVRSTGGANFPPTLLTDILKRFAGKGFGTFEAGAHALPDDRLPAGEGVEAILKVPFADRERVRVAFNIYAAEVEEEFGDGLFLHMESVM